MPGKIFICRTARRLKDDCSSLILLFDDRDNIFVGRILGIRAIIGFHAETVTDLHTAFVEAVDDYLEICAKNGREPQKPASTSGKLMLRIPSEIHNAALVASQSAGMSLNQWATGILKKAIQV